MALHSTKCPECFLKIRFQTASANTVKRCVNCSCKFVLPEPEPVKFGLTDPINFSDAEFGQDYSSNQQAERPRRRNQLIALAFAVCIGFGFLVKCLSTFFETKDLYQRLTQGESNGKVKTFENDSDQITNNTTLNQKPELTKNSQVIAKEIISKDSSVSTVESVAEKSTPSQNARVSRQSDPQKLPGTLDDEGKASGLLSVIEGLLSAKRIDTARRRAEELIQKYPKTKAAEKARQILATWNM
jgi:hypothetical protein